MKIDLANIDSGISTDIQKLLLRAFNDGIDNDIPLCYGNKIKLETAVEGVYVEVYIDANDRLVIPKLYADIDLGATGNEAIYYKAGSDKLSGEITAIRGRGEGKAAEASTAEVRGVHAQGIAYADLFSGTINALYSEAIAKDGSTVVTLRGAMIAADSEGTPTSITNMYGAHIRVKTSVEPVTDFIGLKVETEEFGPGVVLDSFIQLKTITWAAAAECAITGIDFTGVAAKFSHSHIRFPLVALDGDSAIEGDFWYDPAAHVFKFYNGSAARTITDS